MLAFLLQLQFLPVSQTNIPTVRGIRRPGTQPDPNNDLLIDTLDNASADASDVSDNAFGPRWMANNPSNDVTEDSGDSDCNVPA